VAHGWFADRRDRLRHVAQLEATMPLVRGRKSSLKRYRVSAAYFVDVQLRPRRNRHGTGEEAREAQGEALGTAED